MGPEETKHLLRNLEVFVSFKELDFKEGTPIKTVESYGGMPYMRRDSGLQELGGYFS